jgi:hypothetical protein
MDAKSRDSALLSFLSLFCAISAWAGDRDAFGSVFLRSVSRCSAQPIGSGADSLYAKRKKPLIGGRG